MHRPGSRNGAGFTLLQARGFLTGAPHSARLPAPARSLMPGRPVHHTVTPSAHSERGVAEEYRLPGN
ncbi:hypothetical protein GCM10022206_80170 [Streptomyces chiangmaiensis]